MDDDHTESLDRLSLWQSTVYDIEYVLSDQTGTVSSRGTMFIGVKIRDQLSDSRH